jgi:hypothetical protein
VAAVAENVSLQKRLKSYGPRFSSKGFAVQDTLCYKPVR